MASLLSIQLLGVFRVVHGDRLIMTSHSSRAQAVFARLVLKPGVSYHRAQLASLFWPESSEEQARTNLRKHVAGIRSELPDVEQFLVLNGPTLSWNADAPYTLDVTQFEAAAGGTQTAASVAKAVALYGGDLLLGCYDDWIAPERERLHLIFTKLLETGLVLLEAERDYTKALRYAQRLVEHDPLNEAGYQALMRLHAIGNDRAAAIRAYRTSATTLRRKLGVAASQATRESYERLLESELPSPGEPATTVPLVGRTAQWGQLQAAWRFVKGRRAHAVVLSGEAGIGKTRLAEESRMWAESQGLAVARACCYAAEGSLAFGVITTLLRAGPLPRLAHIWLTEIARLLPEVLEQHRYLPRPGPLKEAWQRQRLFDALVQALLAREAPIILIDDLHWCDRDSLEVLHYLLRSARQARLLLVCTLRREELPADHLLHAMLASWRREGCLTEIELPPLDAPSTRQLARHIARREIDEQSVRRLCQETEGNPLFVVEMVRAGLLDAGHVPVSALPPTVRAVIAARLDRLSVEARELVMVAATIGREFSWPASK